MKNILFLIGTDNQTSMMHQIASHLLEDYNCYFSTFYGDGVTKWATNNGFMEMTIVGEKTQLKNRAYCKEHNLQYDFRGENNDYDLILTCQDIEIPNNQAGRPIILVQEGTLTPYNFFAKFIKFLGVKRGFADTALTGLSHAYKFFCVASEGYKKEFVRRGVDGSNIRVTGIPNFDNITSGIENNFPHRDFILVATSNLRESWHSEDRPKFLKKAVDVANGKKMIFKLHPQENKERAIAEIRKYVGKDCLIYTDGDIKEMVVHCDALVTHFSSVSLLAAALGKPVYGEYTRELLKELSPIQNNGTSSKIIADMAKELLQKSN